ncbi:hypothetical protein JQK86_04710 [Clostridium beijerinckii]|uniref:hypothetical protein n=1 Tax=Clostridium beijerinckii TaxID=1520 RepID=UPI0015E173CB|nr:MULTISPECIES: hypothetical protein [Clostridium]MBN7573340.1 hypothetical protein [Clostridium beijerinckii]MBN7583113.1 hypothetical protein [Clostridium beijerinckii]
MINYREIIIIDKVDIPILVYGDNCIVYKHINKESDMKDTDDQIVKKFIKGNYSYTGWFLYRRKSCNCQRKNC